MVTIQPRIQSLLRKLATQVVLGLFVGISALFLPFYDWKSRAEILWGPFSGSVC